VTWSPKQLEFRLAFASASVLSLTAAWAWQVLDPAAGHCLQPTASGLGHCVLCWFAAALAGLALAPYPRLARRSI